MRAGSKGGHETCQEGRGQLWLPGEVAARLRTERMASFRLAQGDTAGSGNGEWIPGIGAAWEKAEQQQNSAQRLQVQ